MNELYKWAGVIGFAVAWIAILLLLAIWETDKTKSISHHVANQRASYLMMAILESISLPLIWVFMIGWLTPVYQLNPLFPLLCSLIVLGLFIAAWVPVTGPKRKYHDISAQTAAILSAPTTLVLALSPSISVHARMVNLVAFASLCLMIVLYFTVRGTHRYFLYFQIISFILFDVAILSAAFIH